MYLVGVGAGLHVLAPVQLLARVVAVGRVPATVVDGLGAALGAPLFLLGLVDGAPLLGLEPLA